MPDPTPRELAKSVLAEYEGAAWEPESVPLARALIEALDWLEGMRAAKEVER